MIWYWSGKGWTKHSSAKWDARAPAVLACPGPSLASTEIPRGYYTLAVNTAYPTVQPDAWIGMDEAWCYDPNLLDEVFPKYSRGTYAEMMHGAQKVKETPSSYFLDIDKVPAGKTMLDLRAHDTKFAWHHHTLGVALHLLIWQGYRTIYLAGCDLGGDQDYCHDLTLSDAHRERNRRLYRNQIIFISKLARAAKAHGIQIISATPNSPINKEIGYQPLQERPRREAQIHHVLDRPVTPVTVLRSGGAYKPEHVQRLAKQVPGLVCLSDVPVPGVKTAPLQTAWPSWWAKMEVFGPSIDGDVLHIDLDTTVRDIQPFLAVGKTTLLRDFYYPTAKASGLMYIRSEDKAKVYDAFVKQADQVMAAKQRPPHHGDQGFISKMLPKAEVWQDLLPGLVKSYKADKDHDCAVLCFHGDPKPWDVGQ